MTNPIVSVFILTYNQEQFIVQTLESILSQKTNFDFQLVIGEDCSTDGTRAICERYAQMFPNKIKLLPKLKNNIGLIANYIRTFKECDGKYIAICDGDDYWIDDFKLQKQVDFLENNDDFSIVYTAVTRLFPDGEMKEYRYHLNKKVIGFDDLILNNFLHSVTAVFRNEQTHENQLPEWISKYPFGDWQTYLWTLKSGGKIHFMNEITAVYRMNIGVSSGYNKKNISFLKLLISILEDIFVDENFNSKKEIVAQSILEKKRDLMTNLNREFQYYEGLKLFITILYKTNEKLRFVKFYLYSIYKSFSKNNPKTT